MGAESRDVRNEAATQLLDFGFANYGIYRCEAAELDPIKVIGGSQNSCAVSHGASSVVLPKSAISSVSLSFSIPESISAPVHAGDEIGRVDFMSGGKSVGSIAVVACVDVDRINFFEVLTRMLARFLLI